VGKINETGKSDVPMVTGTSDVGRCGTIGAKVSYRLDAWVACFVMQEWACLSSRMSLPSVFFDSIHYPTLPNTAVNLLGLWLSD
jgi:hypothetical protein